MSNKYRVEVTLKTDANSTLSATITDGRVVMTDSVTETCVDWEAVELRSKRKLRMITRARKIHRQLFGRNPR